jgi:DNA-binding GntR family transcriptional regulator
MIATEDRHKIKAIPTKTDIKNIRASLKKNIRDLLLFDLATQTGAGMTHILHLKVTDLAYLDIGDHIHFNTSSVKISGDCFMNKTIQSTWNDYIKRIKPTPNEFIFKSRKGNKPLNLSSVSTMVKSWFKKAGLIDLNGTKSLQKTWESYFKNKSQGLSVEKKDKLPYIQPVKVDTITEKVYREISKAIISGHMPPGERILEEKIAEQMKVSRMPVREALHRLQESGFISPYKKMGKVVNQLTLKNLNEITKIRMILEIKAVRLALINMNKKTLTRLENIHISLEKAIESNELDQMLYLNKQFHFTLYSKSDMPILQQILSGLWDRISPYLHILLREGEVKVSIQNVNRYHKGMLEGLRDTDPDMICKWLKADLIEGREMVFHLMNRLGLIESQT